LQQDGNILKDLAKSRIYKRDPGKCCPYTEVGHFQRVLDE
jgi:hypothetical protein